MAGYTNFEFSWEVANKVGGIYQVIKSKVPVSIEELGYDNYVLIGPKFSDKVVHTEVEPAELRDPIMQATVNAMRERGIGVFCGKWLVDGLPQVILFDIGSLSKHLDDWRHELFSKTRISGPFSDSEFNDCILYGFGCAWFIGEYLHQFNEVHGQDPLTICHFHEWLAGVGLIMSKIRKLNVATIFTTHATLLGRYLCADPTVDFYNNLNNFDLDYEAGRRQIYHRYCVERAAADLSHVFTAVSQITADEAEALLCRRPDVITPNGLNVKKWSAPHEFQSLHAKSKAKIEQFMQGHFYGHLDFDLDKTIYMFSAGRYEYRNKGADMFIEALARLNKKLMDEQSDITVAAFFIFNGKTNSFNVESLEGQSHAKAMRESCQRIQEQIGNRIFDAVSHGRIPRPEDLMKTEDVYELKSKVYGAEGRPLPPIVTHNLIDRQNDPITNKLVECKLHNNWWDKVKVIFHPEFLKSTNPLIPMDYIDFARGCHLGVFPSYYEPWGYTPAECTVMGIPSVSTNLSGFGTWMEEHIPNSWQYGIYVNDRRFKNFNDAAESLANNMLGFCKQSRRQRIIQRNRTERLSEFLDWKNLGRYYHEARQLAFDRVLPESLKEQLKENQKSFRPRIPSYANLANVQTQPNSPFHSRPASRSASEFGDCDNNNDFNDDEEGEEDVNVYDEDTGILIGSFKPEKPTAEEITKRTENLQI